MKLWRMPGVLLGVSALFGCVAFGCSPAPDDGAGRTIRLATGAPVKTLDPALAGDLASRNLAGALYDTLLQYDYLARPYKLIPSMLAVPPEANADSSRFVFTLRDDLYFAADPAFDAQPAARKVTSRDVIFSFLRIADARLHSPVFWLFRGKVKGIDEFNRRSGAAPVGDRRIYELPVAGFEILDDRHFAINLTRPDPRFLYNLAIPYTGIVSRRAVEFYGDAQLATHPVGSGAFTLAEWVRDYRLTLRRNPEFRREFFAGAATRGDRSRPLPLADKIVCYSVRQPLAAWLLFLQGELDLSVLNKDNLDLVAGGDHLAPALAARGIELLKQREFEIQYIGFNFGDPKLGRNLKLRQAIACAYNIDARIEHANFLMVKALGPIPPGVSGYSDALRNPVGEYDLPRAKALLAAAGYPGGIDPATGAALTLEFDQSNSSSQHRQLGEMMVSDLGKIGIKVKASLNNGPRFYQKLGAGEMQLFRLSWVGDYPDAENFLQLFYSKNIGGCNRVGFCDATFDAMFEAASGMADTPERTRRYEAMAQYLVDHTPWIFESYPVSFQLKHGWLENYVSHDFGFNRWKYWSVDTALRRRMKKTFKPLSMQELR